MRIVLIAVALLLAGCCCKPCETVRVELPDYAIIPVELPTIKSDGCNQVTCYPGGYCSSTLLHCAENNCPDGQVWECTATDGVGNPTMCRCAEILSVEGWR